MTPHTKYRPPSQKEGTGNSENKEPVPPSFGLQITGVKEGNQSGTVSHNVRGALGPRTTPSFMVAVLSQSRWAQAKRQVERKRSTLDSENEVMPKDGSGIGLPKSQDTLLSTLKP